MHKGAMKINPNSGPMKLRLRWEERVGQLMMRAGSCLNKQVSGDDLIFFVV